MPLSKFPWDTLPREVKVEILSCLPLTRLHALQTVFPNDAPVNFSRRVAALFPLWRAWLDSPIAVRNVTGYRTRDERQSCSPLEFVSLERLVLGSARLCRLPPAIAEFRQSLKVLHLDDNYLTDLPEELRMCEELLLLDCNQNAFQKVPSSVLKLRRLRCLFFAQNSAVTLLPPEFARMPELVVLSFHKCALTELPVELVRKAVETSDFSLNVAQNNFPRRYLMSIGEAFPAFKKRLNHVMVE